MEKEFWHERWALGEIGFHRSSIHPFLVHFFDRMEVSRGDKVFVPLCGKSLDMLWLQQQGVEVVGVELSATAVEAFFAEQGIEASRRSEGTFDIYQSEGIRLFCGDLFSLERDDLDGAVVFYDRASLVALPPSMRQGYADKIAQLIPAGGKGLLVSYDYDQAQRPGPPFAVPFAEVAKLFGSAFDMELLAEEDALRWHQGLTSQGITELREFACLLVRK